MSSNQFKTDIENLTKNLNTIKNKFNTDCCEQVPIIVHTTDITVALAQKLREMIKEKNKTHRLQVLQSGGANDKIVPQNQPQQLARASNDTNIDITNDQVVQTIQRSILESVQAGRTDEAIQRHAALTGLQEAQKARVAVTEYINEMTCTAADRRTGKNRRTITAAGIQGALIYGSAAGATMVTNLVTNIISTPGVVIGQVTNVTATAIIGTYTSLTSTGITSWFITSPTRSAQEIVNDFAGSISDNTYLAPLTELLGNITDSGWWLLFISLFMLFIFMSQFLRIMSQSDTFSIFGLFTLGKTQRAERITEGERQLMNTAQQMITGQPPQQRQAIATPRDKPDSNDTNVPTIEKIVDGGRKKKHKKHVNPNNQNPNNQNPKSKKIIY